MKTTTLVDCTPIVALCCSLSYLYLQRIPASFGAGAAKLVTEVVRHYWKYYSISSHTLSILFSLRKNVIIDSLCSLVFFSEVLVIFHCKMELQGRVNVEEKNASIFHFIYVIFCVQIHLIDENMHMR
jgi:hypothetical protein